MNSADGPRNLNRRQLLKGMLGTAAGASLSACRLPGGSLPFANSRKIERENAKQGTREWMLTKTAVDPKTKYRCPSIEGYVSRTSYRAGESIQFFVSCNPSTPFRIDVFRLGYYGGAGGRKVAALGPFSGQTQPDPDIGEKRLRDCQWEACTELTVPHDWLSGVYLGKLTAEKGGWQSYVIFIVRDDRPADFVFQCSDTTWQAYNRWPSQFALYDNDEHQWWWGGDVQVSFNRPYGKYCQILDAPLSTGSGEFLLWEFPIAYWLEANGYDVTYISNLDLHTNPETLQRAKGFLSVGHDEYWSIEMFRHMQSAIAGGLNVGFLSGNSVCGRILFAQDSQGMPNRVFERVGVFGPPGGTREICSHGHPSS